LDLVAVLQAEDEKAGDEAAEQLDGGRGTASKQDLKAAPAKKAANEGVLTEKESRSTGRLT
jgi:hypothetical protein